uniref:Uncharacterized protein n=1 Tax=Oryza nivara TaxID=4536 RepID=A0A0E0IJU5_ORYNI
MAARPTGGTAANRRRSLAVIVSKCKAAVGRRRSRGWSGFSGNCGHCFPPSSAAARFDWYTVPLFEFFHQNLFDQKEDGLGSGIAWDDENMMTTSIGGWLARWVDGSGLPQWTTRAWPAEDEHPRRGQ